MTEKTFDDVIRHDSALCGFLLTCIKINFSDSAASDKIMRRGTFVPVDINCARKQLIALTATVLENKTARFEGQTLT